MLRRELKWLRAAADFGRLHRLRDDTMGDEAQARKARSIAILKAEGIPFIEHLPAIESESESTRRMAAEVATRAIALCLVAVKGEGLDQKSVEKSVQEYGLDAALTPKEKRFIDNHNPSAMERVQFTWRYECYWVMLWALEYLPDLGRPDKICDVKLAVSLLRKSNREEFTRKANLRAQTEILDAADLIYRYHWAVRDERVNGSGDAPEGLNGGVVMERHYALNWLIGYLDRDWDDVTTDT